MTYYVSSFSLPVNFIDIDTISQLMHSSTGFRQTQIIVTKLFRLIIETGSITGLYSLHFPVVRRSTLSTFSCCRSTQPYPLFCFPWPDILCDTRFHHIQAVPSPVYTGLCLMRS